MLALTSAGNYAGMKNVPALFRVWLKALLSAPQLILYFFSLGSNVPGRQYNVSEILLISLGSLKFVIISS